MRATCSPVRLYSDRQRHVFRRRRRGAGTATPAARHIDGTRRHAYRDHGSAGSGADRSGSRRAAQAIIDDRAVVDPADAARGRQRPRRRFAHACSRSMPRVFFAMLPVFAGDRLAVLPASAFPAALVFAVHLHAFAFLVFTDVRGRKVHALGLPIAGVVGVSLMCHVCRLCALVAAQRCLAAAGR